MTNNGGEKEDMKYFIEMSVDYFTRNYPEHLEKLLTQ